MAKPDFFDEIKEGLKAQALVSPDTYVSPEVLREFYADIVKPPPVPPAGPRPAVPPGGSARPGVQSVRQTPPAPAPNMRSSSAAPAGKSPREMTWDELANAVAACHGCKLCRTRTNTVFGDGDPKARLMFLGEAPGADEDRQGLPFVGRAGELLTRMICAMQFNRAEVFIANTVKCRPRRRPQSGSGTRCRSR